MTQKLSQEDWLAAGFRALASEGHSALKAEAIARDLQTTKGSFYWHFKNLSEYKTAMIILWKDRATNEIIEELNSLPKGRKQLEALIQLSRHTPNEFGGDAVEPAIRDWARIDEKVAKSMREVDSKRITFLQEQLTEMGYADLAYAQLFYAAHLGFEQLARSTPKRSEEEMQTLLSLLDTQ